MTSLTKRKVINSTLNNAARQKGELENVKMNGNLVWETLLKVRDLLLNCSRLVRRCCSKHPP